MTFRAGAPGHTSQAPRPRRSWIRRRSGRRQTGKQRFPHSEATRHRLRSNCNTPRRKILVGLNLNYRTHNLLWAAKMRATARAAFALVKMGGENRLTIGLRLRRTPLKRLCNSKPSRRFEKTTGLCWVERLSTHEKGEVEGRRASPLRTLPLTPRHPQGRLRRARRQPVGAVRQRALAPAGLRGRGGFVSNSRDEH